VLVEWGRDNGAVMAAPEETAISIHVSIRGIGRGLALNIPSSFSHRSGAHRSRFGRHGCVGGEHVVERGLWTRVSIHVDLDGSGCVLFLRDRLVAWCDRIIIC
jgi:hypothetical protein